MESAIAPIDNRGFQIALVSALPLEADCVQGIFDKFWEDEGRRYERIPTDPNTYTTGVIGRHNVVLAYLPGMGVVSAAAFAGSIRLSFPNITLVLLVGICGGLPLKPNKEEIVLGDVIISQALIQYDFGRKYQEGFQRKTNVQDVKNDENIESQLALTTTQVKRTKVSVIYTTVSKWIGTPPRPGAEYRLTQDTLGRPSPEIRAFLKRLQTHRYLQQMQSNTSIFLADVQKRVPGTIYPGVEKDILYQPSYAHKHNASAACDVCQNGDHICQVALETSCEDLGCESAMRVPRERLIDMTTAPPRVHFGIMGSGNMVMKSGQDRDRIAKVDDIIAFEMEGAGIWDYFPTIVVKGVCDYADSHKNKSWQLYAAATAAAGARAILSELTVKATACPTRYSNFPHKGSRYFSGREAELSEMRRLLTSSNSQHCVAIWGVAGSGKTELAIQYARRFEKDFGAIFFVHARNELSIQQDLQAIAKLVNLPQATGPGPESAEQFAASSALIDALKQWFIGFDDNWLLIVDNVDLTQKLNLDKYLPLQSQARGSIIMTSQDRTINVYGPSIEVGEMSIEAAKDLFVKLLGCQEPAESQLEICHDIVTELGYLALPVEHAGAYVRSTGMPLHKYLQRIKDNLEYYLKETPTASLHQVSTYATLQITYQAVAARNNRAAELLGFLTCVDNKALLESWLLSKNLRNTFTNWQCHTGVEDFYKIKSVLLSFSLIKSHETEDDATISMHSLVHAGIRLLLTVKSAWLMLLRAAAFVVLSNSDNEPARKVWYPHVQLAVNLSARLFQQHGVDLSHENLWIILATLIFRYRLFWQVTGRMTELDELSKTTIEALGHYTSSEAKCKSMLVAGVRCTTLQFTHGPEAGLSMMYDMLLEKMTTSAFQYIQRLRQDGDSTAADLDFRPCTLVEVFTEPDEPLVLEILIEVLQRVAVIECGRPGRQKIGTSCLRLSQLPRKENWETQARRILGMGLSLTREVAGSETVDVASCAANADRDRQTGNIDSTIHLLQNMIATFKPLSSGGPGLHEGAVYDLAKIFVRIGRVDEARTTIRLLQYADSDAAELEIARLYIDFYVWTRKIKASLYTSHEDHGKAEAILQRAHKSACACFGKGSLSELHSALLLEQFYRQDCCSSPAEADRLLESYAKGFTDMYSSQIRIEQGEGLNMGKTLMAQGALMEAIVVFRFFALAAEKILGPDTAMAKKARRWEAHAIKERSVEESSDMNGRAVLVLGCVTFPRNVETLGVEDGL